jgi:hypothetical protein
LVLVALMLCGGVACTGGSPSPRPPAGGTPTSSGAPKPDSAPFRVRVTRVSGHLSPAGRAALAHEVGATLTSYVDAAFLSGRYPRSDFSDAFASFTPGAAAQARQQLGLLTNRQLGPSTVSVRAVRRTAALSVLAPSSVAAGVTARVDLDLLVKRSAGSPQRVRLTGRLLLTRLAGGRWAIFGYDVARSDTPVRSTS